MSAKNNGTKPQQMNQSDNTIPGDRSLELTYNIELLWGNIICNAPAVVKDSILHTRAFVILSSLQQFHNDLSRNHNQ